MVGRLALEKFHGAFLPAVIIAGSFAGLEPLDHEDFFAAELLKLLLGQLRNAGGDVGIMST